MTLERQLVATEYSALVGSECLRRTLAVMVLLNGLSACTGETSGADSPEAPTKPGSTQSVETVVEDGYKLIGPLLTAPRCELADSSDCDPGDALFQGKLVHEDGCLFIEAGDLRLAVLWPWGTVWQEKPEAVVTEGAQYLVGHDIEIGGGGQNIDNLTDFYPASDPPTELLDCASTPGAQGFWQTG